jgi:hypothetical protein
MSIRIKNKIKNQLRLFNFVLTLIFDPNIRLAKAAMMVQLGQKLLPLTNATKAT